MLTVFPQVEGDVEEIGEGVKEQEGEEEWAGTSDRAGQPPRLGSYRAARYYSEGRQDLHTFDMCRGGLIPWRLLGGLWKAEQPIGH
ncbi:unnamed protein product [Arctogadus glacialis]